MTTKLSEDACREIRTEVRRLQSAILRRVATRLNASPNPAAVEVGIVLGDLAEELADQHAAVIAAAVGAIHDIGDVAGVIRFAETLPPPDAYDGADVLDEPRGTDDCTALLEQRRTLRQEQTLRDYRQEIGG